MAPENDREQQDLDVEIATVFKDLPKPVQGFLLSEDRGRVARELSQKYSLHVDQAGEFERAFILMLLGVEKPEEFVSSLSAAGLTQDVINGLAADVNERVFIPLREAERAAASRPIPAPKKPEPIPPPALDYQPRATLPGSSVPTPMPPTPAPPTEPVSVQPAQQHTMHVAPEGHPAGWHPAAAVHIFVPSHQPAPVAYSPAAPTPPTQTESAVPVFLPHQPPTPQPAPPTQPAQSVLPEKNYVADPYREPV